MVIPVTKVIKEAREELKNVTWPTKKQTINLTTVVIGLSIVIGVYLSLLDYGFGKVLNNIL